MIALIDENRIVLNVIVASLDEAPEGTWIECPEWVGIGMSIDTPDPTPTIPTEVSMRQARLALFQQGILNNVQSAIDSMIDPQKTIAQISWDYATVVQRDDDLVLALSSVLSLDSSALDELFTLASTL